MADRMNFMKTFPHGAFSKNYSTTFSASFLFLKTQSESRLKYIIIVNERFFLFTQ